MTKAEDLGPKEKPIFYRRKKNGEIITNDPNLKKPEVEKKAMTDASQTQNDDVWFDDVDPVLLDPGATLEEFRDAIAILDFREKDCTYYF